MRADGVVRGIVLATFLTVALEVGVLGLNGVDVNPLDIGTEQAQAATDGYPPDTSIDCDTDKDGGTDLGESSECADYNGGTNWLADNQDLFFYGLAGLAAGVLIISVGLILAPEIFATAGLFAAYGTASTLFPTVYFSSEFYLLTTAIGGLSAYEVGYAGFMGATAPSSSPPANRSVRSS